MVSERDRIRLDAKPDKYAQISAGDMGTVEGKKMLPSELTGGDAETKIFVDWDEGSNLALIQEQDSFTVIDNED